jgi:hypothetical protein
MVLRRPGVDSHGTPDSPPEALMLTLVRDNETPAQLAARRQELADAVAAIAAAPVQHVPASFLAAVEGLFVTVPLQAVR